MAPELSSAFPNNRTCESILHKLRKTVSDPRIYPAKKLLIDEVRKRDFQKSKEVEGLSFTCLWRRKK